MIIDFPSNDVADFVLFFKFSNISHFIGFADFVVLFLLFLVANHVELPQYFNTVRCLFG